MSQHIDWREVMLKSLLLEGSVSDASIAMLKKELKSSTGSFYAEGVTFLCDLRKAYGKKAKAKKEAVSEAFEKFFFKTVTDYVLKDEEISEHEAGWLRDTLFADSKIDDAEWAFLQNLNKKAKTKSSAFNTLYSDAEKKRGEGAEKPAAAAKPKKKAAPKS